MRWMLILLLLGSLIAGCHRDPPQNSGKSNIVCSPSDHCYQVTIEQSCAVISEQGEWTEYRCWQRRK